MAVTKQVYTATGIWTASQLATIFESAFVASGLMTAWYDSFTSGSVENRILEVVYDGGATYGTTYYWFQFTTSGAFAGVSGTWDAGSHVPTGTQYLDYYSTTTSSTNNHWQILSLSAASNVSLIRYTSAVDTTQSWYVLVQGSSSLVFTIPPGSFTISPWVDMDKVLFSHFMVPHLFTQTSYGYILMGSYGFLRRSYGPGGGFIASTDNGQEFAITVQSVVSPGRSSNSTANNIGRAQSLGFVTKDTTPPALGPVIAPMGNSTANPAYSANFSPVFTGLPHSHYISTPNMAADFGIAFHYADNTMVRGDKLIVTASVEEWEIMRVSNNATVTSGASPMFLARVV
jgi:hypothetical protein